MGCLCCVSGPLSMTVYTDRGGYCPGESIGVSAVINNNSDNEVISLEIQLIQLTVYIASTGRYRTCANMFYDCGVPESIHTPCLEGHLKFLGGGVS